MAFSTFKKQYIFLFIYQLIFYTVQIHRKKYRQKFYCSSFNERMFFGKCSSYKIKIRQKMSANSLNLKLYVGCNNIYPSVRNFSTLFCFNNRIIITLSDICSNFYKREWKKKGKLFLNHLHLHNESVSFLKDKKLIIISNAL